MENAGLSRKRLLYVFRLLHSETDEKHTMSMPEILARLEAVGISAERKSLYEDFEALREVLGLDVRYQANHGWYLSSHSFDSAELALMVDTILAARFLTDKRSREIVDKITSLGSRHQKERLQRTVWVEGRVKADADSLNNIDIIQESLRRGRLLSFQYFRYDEHKQKQLRRNGMRYLVSPQALIWSHENYYLVGIDHAHDGLRHYRVDKMQKLDCLSRRSRPVQSPFDPAVYSKQHFEMYGGRVAQVCLRCDKSLVGVLLDHFGMDVKLTPDGEEHVLLETELAVSPQLLGWLFGLGEQAAIVSPYWAVLEYQTRLRNVLATHVRFLED